MRILLIARTCPFPVNDGEKTRVFNLIKHLSHHDITLVCRTMSEEEKKGVTELKKYCKSIHDVYIPSPKSIVERIRWILPFLFSKYPISLSTIYFKEISDVISKLCREINFDIVQIEHSSLTIYMDYLKFSKKITSILVMHNIDYIRNKRIIKTLSFGVRKLFYLINQFKFRKWELKAIERYNCVITMSDIDKKILKRDRPNLNYKVLPNGVGTKEVEFCLNNKQVSTNHLIFVASMDSEANHDGAMYFIDNVFQLIKKKFPETRVSFVGRNPRRELLQKHNDKDIIVTGMVDSVFEYYQKASVAIVPLRSGGGTRLKILESMAAGVPVVSTTVGAEGLNVTNAQDIMLADTPAEFADCVNMLFGSISLRKTIARKARQKVENEYDWSIIAQKCDLIYGSLIYK